MSAHAYWHFFSWSSAAAPHRTQCHFKQLAVTTDVAHPRTVEVAHKTAVDAAEIGDVNHRKMATRAHKTADKEDSNERFGDTIVSDL